MTNESKIQITPGQFCCFLLQAQIGTQLVALPHRVQMVAKGGAWISVLLGGLLIQLVVFVLWALCKRWPGKNLYQMNKQILGKWIGSLLNGVYSVYFLLGSAFTLLIFITIAKEWVFPKTPWWFLLLTIALISLYLACSSLQVIARFMVLSTLLLPSLLFLVIMGFSVADFTYPLPFLEAGWSYIFKGSYGTMLSLSGFEVMLFIYPYVQGTDGQKLRMASLAIWTTTLIYAILVYTSLVVFSPQEIALVPEPVIYMLKAIRFSLIERLDLLFLNLGVLSTATTLAIALYISSKGWASMTKRNQYQKFVPVVALVAGILPYLVHAPIDVDRVSDQVLGVIFVFAVLTPILLWILSLLFHRRRRT